MMERVVRRRAEYILIVELFLTISTIQSWEKSLNIFIKHSKVKMVKTRKQSKQPQENTQHKQVLKVTPKKTRKPQWNIRIEKDKLREGVKTKMIRRNSKAGFSGRKNIDFNNQEFQSLIVAQKFNCPICLEIMIFPVLTLCGHAFCLPCLEQSLKHKNVCSLCRQPVSYQHFKQSTIIEKLIRQVEERSMDDKQLDLYHSRLRQFKEKDKERIVDSQVKVGDFVDFYNNRSWNQGTVLQIDNRGQKPILRIESTQREVQIYKFQLGSRLIAKHRYFTKENTLFRDLMGQFRFQISGFGDLPIFVYNQNMQQNLINVQINPVRSQTLQHGFDDLIRLTFTIQP